MNKFVHSSLVAVSCTLMMVAAGCASTASQRSTGQVVDDGVLVTKVKTALIGNDQTKARQIDVESYRGEVQLNGFVDSDAARQAAVTTAKGVEGVRSVKNNLQIRASDRSAGQVVDDGMITTRVKTALIGDPRTKALQIEVKTNNGIVQLAGFVDSATSKSAAAELAHAVDGVKSVSNELEVR